MIIVALIDALFCVLAYTYLAKNHQAILILHTTYLSTVCFTKFTTIFPRQYGLP